MQLCNFAKREIMQFQYRNTDFLYRVLLRFSMFRVTKQYILRYHFDFRKRATLRNGNQTVEQKITQGKSPLALAKYKRCVTRTSGAALNYFTRNHYRHPCLSREFFCFNLIHFPIRYKFFFQRHEHIAHFFVSYYYFQSNNQTFRISIEAIESARESQKQTSCS